MARLKTTDVYAQLQGRYDPVLINIIVSIVERQEVQHAQMMSCAEGINHVLDKMIEISQATGNIARSQTLISGKLKLGDMKSVVQSYEEKDDDPNPTR